MTTASSYITNTGANVLTSSGNTVLTWMSVTNYTAGDATANIHVMRSGGLASNVNMIVANVLITAGDTFQLYVGNEKLVLENGTSVYAIANISNALSTVLSYTAA